MSLILFLAQTWPQNTRTQNTLTDDNVWEDSSYVQNFL